MTAFRVWAPHAQRVEVEVGEERIAMAPAERGWHEVEVAWAGPGADYRFVLDGGEPLPDPRSPCQPDGVHGPSRVIDRSAFSWTDGDWHGIHLPSAVLYELHVGTFTEDGTFEAVVPRLDHLVELGVTAIELMPVVEFPGRWGWGYDGVDLYAPHHAYGGPEGLMHLVDACHARGLGVVIDVVYNHLGPDGNYLGAFGPYFTDRYVTPWGQAVNLDGAGSDEVRRFFLDNALMWLDDYHCDGLRVDAVHAILDTSATHLLEELAAEVDARAARLGRALFVIAESDLNDPRLVRRPEVGGYGLDAQWSDDFHHALHAALTGERDGYYADFGALSQVAYALEHAYVYDGRYSAHRNRRHGRPATGLPGHRFLGYLQTHDQVGNRAAGDRTAAMLSTERLKIAATLVLTAPFVPMLFMGEEWAATTPFQYFTDHADPELGRAVSEGRRREFAAFGWDPADVPDPQDPATFERSRLDWAEPARAPHAEVLEWHRRLIALRRSRPALADSRLESVRARADDDTGSLVVERGDVTVVANIGPAPVQVPLDGRPAHVLLASGSVVANGPSVTLGPDSVAVLGPPSSTTDRVVHDTHGAETGMPGSPTGQD